jgi:hypothetical protein
MANLKSQPVILGEAKNLRSFGTCRLRRFFPENTRSERTAEILRFAQNDSQGAQNDGLVSSQLTAEESN